MEGSRKWRGRQRETKCKNGKDQTKKKKERVVKGTKYKEKRIVRT